MTTLKLTFLLILISLPATTTAQPFRGSRPVGAERIEQLKKVRMIGALNLSEEQSIRFFARLNEHENAQKELLQEKDELLDDLEDLAEGTPDEEECIHLFSEIRAIEDRMRLQDREFFDGLDEILSVQQRAELVLFDRQFQNELREAVRTLHRRSQHP